MKKIVIFLATVIIMSVVTFIISRHRFDDIDDDEIVIGI
jgi:hypothetical protein